ncbi:MAG: DUF2828 family protein [Synergistaceae bacterium]|nr:DUF2828 family protein [Synergistaceae bacterium]
MLEYLKEESNKTITENLAATHKSTLSDCLDLFATAGALRNAYDDDIELRFARAFIENRDLAAKIAFYARDVRGGLGERKFFRVVLQWLARNSKSTVIKNLALIPEYGRYDDVLTLFGTPCEEEALDFIQAQLNHDIDDGKNVSLLAKWLPSINASSKKSKEQAMKITKFLGMDYRTYRQVLTTLRAKIKLIENNLRKKDYTFDYSKQPAKAMLKYRKAFIRNDGDRYGEFMENVAQGKTKLHTGTLTPYEIILPLVSWEQREFSEAERKSLDVTWNAQEDFTKGENALVVVDGSGSMYREPGVVSPIAVAVSLGIYFAERNSGAFKNHFITFSATPQLVEIKGKDIFEKVTYCKTFDEAANTNIQKVFELIVNTAAKNNLPQSELPSTLYIISDMEFDYCVDSSLTNFEYAKKIFAEKGYKLPRVVFWNVDSRNRQQPVTKNEQGVNLVSGCSPIVFSMIVDNDVTPEGYMLMTLNSPRYANITA